MNKLSGKALAHEPHRGGDADKSEAPAASKGGSEVGEEKHYSRKAWTGNPSEHNPLKGAVGHLKSEHPYKHDDHGPHHGKKHHDRHEPLHGMHPKSRHGRG